MSARAEAARTTGRRWLKFNLVGAIGIVVQLAVLGILNGILKLDYLPATALAVEAAVLHNFLWHERFTWADRASVTGGKRSCGWFASTSPRVRSRSWETCC